jgi:hypothetical protein
MPANRQVAVTKREIATEEINNHALWQMQDAA